MIKKAVTIINDFSGGIDTKTPIISGTLNKSPNMRNFHSAGVRNRLMKRGGFSKLNSSSVENDGLDTYYPPGYQTADYNLRDTATNTEIAQGFKPKTTGSVSKVRVWLKKVGSPTGNINVEIQTNSGGVPSGTAVSNGTSSNVDISTLASTYGWITFTFATNPSLTADTQYHLVLQGDNTINGSAYAVWGADDYDIIYQDGNMSKQDGTTWTSDSNYDAIFELYISNGDLGNTNFALWDFSSKNMQLGMFGTFLYKMDKNSTGTPDGVWDSVPGGSSWDNYTKVVSHFDGSDAAVAYTDPIAGAYTFAGTAQLDTAQKKFGTASLLLDGDSDYVTLPDSADWNFGSGDFTLDFQVRFAALTAGTVQTFISQGDITLQTVSFVLRYIVNSNVINFHYSTDGIDSTQAVFSWSPSINTWYHIALVRNGSNLKCFIDGVQIGSTETISVTLYNSTQVLNIGARIDNGSYLHYLNGWIDEVRISKGIARWTANFTPPISAYSATALPLTSSRYFTFGDWQSGRALINTDIGLYTYIGSGDASVVSAAPIGKFFIIWKKYAFIFGIRGSPNNGRYSALSDYTTWDAANTFSNAFDTNDGDVITGARILKGRLYVFKRYSVHRITYLGSNPTFQVDQILGIGCPSHYCIKEVDMGGDIGAVLVFPTTDKKLAIFDGYNVQVIADVVSEESNDLFASADDQPITFADMDYTYIDQFHATVKQDSYEYILYCVLNGDTTINYAFVLDYKIGAIFPYDGQPFASSLYMMSTDKSKILYGGGYSGYTYQLENGNSDDGSAINAYWVSWKIQKGAVGLLNKNLLLGINCKEITSGSTLNIGFQYRFDWNVSWNVSQNFTFNHNDELAFGKTVLFDIGSISNMLQIKLKDSSTNPAPTIYSIELYGEPQPLGTSVGDRATV